MLKFFRKKTLIIFRFGKSIGDQLITSGLIKRLNSEKNINIILLIRFTEFFKHNPYVTKVIKFDTNLKFHNILLKVLKILKLNFIIDLTTYNTKQNGYFELKNYPDIHLSEFLFRNLKLNINLKSLKPYINFSDKELAIYDKKFKLPKNFSIIQAEGKINFTPNKEWGFENFQKVVNLTSKIQWVQITKNNNQKKLNNVIHFHSLSLRELSYLIYRSEFVLCLEGLYNHIAAAFDKKTFLILSGFTTTKNVEYKNNIIIKNEENLKCSPCYKLYNCDIHGKPCTNQISPDNVVKKINEFF